MCFIRDQLNSIVVFILRQKIFVNFTFAFSFVSLFNFQDTRTKISDFDSYAKNMYVFCAVSYSSLIFISDSFGFFCLLFFFSKKKSKWWAQVDSNHRPHAYQACALTTWAMSPCRFGDFLRPPLTLGGDEEDRTPDPLRAKQVLSQLSYTPVFQGSGYQCHFPFFWDQGPQN